MTTDDHYFIGDIHLAHANVIKHDNRPYDNISEHDRDLTRMCAGAAKKNATLWLVGDVSQTKDAFMKFMEAIRPHWGKIILIRGNHDDKVAWKYRDMFDEAHEARYLRVSPEVKVYISHYAHRVWRNSHHGSYHIYAHSHGALPGVGRSADCGAPCVEYAPKPLTWFVDRLRDQPSVNHHPKKVTPVEDVGGVLHARPMEVRVLSVSANANSFGLHGVILMDRRGRAWEIGVSLTSPALPNSGDNLTAMITPAGDIRQGSLPFTFEIPRILSTAPPEVVKEVWG